MKLSNNIFSSLVAVSGATFEHVSENFAKHLPYQHPFSTKLNPRDQVAAQLSESVVICETGIFIAKERIASYIAKNGGSADYPVSGEKIALCEWPTNGRIIGIEYYATTGDEDPEDYNTNYFTADTAAAFPGFTLSAIDPKDTTFELPLLEDYTETLTDSNTDTVDVVTPRLSLQARAHGINRLSHPLVIAATLTGTVVDNSALFVNAYFAVPRF